MCVCVWVCVVANDPGLEEGGWMAQQREQEDRSIKYQVGNRNGFFFGMMGDVLPMRGLAVKTWWIVEWLVDFSGRAVGGVVLEAGRDGYSEDSRRTRGGGRGGGRRDNDDDNDDDEGDSGGRVGMGKREVSGGGEDDKVVKKKEDKPEPEPERQTQTHTY